MKSASPRDRQLGRMLARGKVTPGSELERVIKMTSEVMKDMGAAGAPMVAADVYTPTPESQPVKRKKFPKSSK